MREAKTMRSKQIMAATAVALLAGVAACTGGRSGTVYNSSFTVGYDPRSPSAAMSRAPLLVENVGTPTEGQAEEDVSRAHVQALRHRGPARAEERRVGKGWGRTGDIAGSTTNEK